MRKLIKLLVLLPVAIILILLSVANRQTINFSLDPFNTEAPAIAFSLPFFVFLFLALFAGMIIGSFLTWFSQGRHRKALREKSYEADRLMRENENNIKTNTDKNREIAPGLPMVSGS